MISFSDLRRRHGYSQRDVARLSGLRFETISRIEAGKNRPHRKTVAKLAKVLEVDEEVVDRALLAIAKQGQDEPYVGWRFLAGLDGDLRAGLIEQLICQWTHHSTGLEGNTISAGDTHLILTQGLTVSGKSLREHEEIHGHGSAIKLISSWLNDKQKLSVGRCHELHRLVQTERTLDAYAPVGQWKVEANGTTAIRSQGDPEWHEYSHPRHVAALMDQWLELFNKSAKVIVDGGSAIDVYTTLHLAFVSIHPYADGNGRLARLLANIPLLKAGLPPVLVKVESRRDYLTLLGDYCATYPAPKPGESLVHKNNEFRKLLQFFEQEWQPVRQLIAEFHDRQKQR